MKRLVVIFALLILPFASLPARELKKEWRDYYRLSRGDRPLDQIAKLHEIRTLALERKLPDDLLDACRAEERINSQMNWKTGDSLHRALTEVIESFGEPLLTYRWLDRDMEYAMAHREELESGCHPYLQRPHVHFLQSQDENDITNDFEWILWNRITGSPGLIPDSQEYRLLNELIGNRYPARPYLQYLAARRAEDCLSALQAVMDQYSGDAFRFIPGKEILDERLERLRKDKKATEESFKKLYDDAGAFSREEKAEKGVHKRMNLSVDYIRRTLKASSMNIGFQNDSIVLTGRNIGMGTLTFSSGANKRIVFFRNRHRRFYMLDTVKVHMPVLPDGSYYVFSDDHLASSTYNKHTISLAIRQQGKAFAVYVADYKTGEPVPSSTICLTNPRNGKKVLEREISLDGFTVLPGDIQNKIGKKNTLLEARVGERRSSSVNVARSGKDVVDSPAMLHARIYNSQGAYRPGDTLRAKAILYEGDLCKKVNTLPEGKDVQIVFYNAERKKLASIDLKTNAFGSIAWEWPIPVGERNGLWDIEVVYHKQTAVCSSFRVDDFVLPTFEVSFDSQSDPYLPDTPFVVKGKLVSYSGHPVDGISLDGLVTRNGKVVWQGTVFVDGDGSLRIPFEFSEEGDYLLNVRALDTTGETRDFKYRFAVSSRLSLRVELDNAGSDDFSLRGTKLEETVLTEPVGRFSWTVQNGDKSVRLPIIYQLLGPDGKTLMEGTSDEILELDMSVFPDGLYFLRGNVAAGKYHAQVDQPVLKLTSRLDARVRSVFLPGETEIENGLPIRARFGAGDGQLWAVVTLTAPDGKILESRLVHLDGINSIMDVEYIYKDTYPDAVRLEIFYFRDEEQVTHKADYHRVRHIMDLPLSFSRFEDRTRPGSPYTLSLQTKPGVEAAVAVFDKSLDTMAPNVWERVELLQPEFRKPWFQTISGFVTGDYKQLFAGDRGLVSGIVVDEEGKPVIGAVIMIQWARQGVIADMDGRFSLNVPAGTPLEINCLGYLSTTARASSDMRIVLREDTQKLEDVVVIGYGTLRRGDLRGRLAGLSSSSGIRIRGTNSRADEFVQEDSFVGDVPEFSDNSFRNKFSESLAFEPFLYPDAAGNVGVTFRTSDKLSTYHVNVFAHEPSMRNAAMQRDFVVTVPVQISVTPPRYLYGGDCYSLSVSVSNISSDTLRGRLYSKVEMKGEEIRPITVHVADLTVPAAGTATALFPITVPLLPQSASAAGPDDQELDIRLVFEGDCFNDAVRLSVPVYRAEQLLTECHSALAGKEAVDSLRGLFVNFPGDKAETAFMTLREVVEDGLEQWTFPEDPDALSLSADFYARALLGRDTTGTLAPLMALRQSDGGFAWTEGQDSSPVVTATLLERFAVLRDRGITIPDMAQTVRYLDYFQLGNWYPQWCGGLSDEEYMDIRAMWSGIPLDTDRVEDKAIRQYRLRNFRRFARKYLTPGRYDYANGWVLDKARRVRTLRNLTASESGLALGKAWGEVLFTASRFDKSIKRDLISLQQYAVPHPSGGFYYPNAILPFRGLLSSEVYAHALLSGLLDGPVSDGLRLWLILQNETQSWTCDPAYLDALQIVQSSPDSILNRRIVTLTACGSIPLVDIHESGNGMRINRQFYLEEDGKRTVLQPGDTLLVGDKVIACYGLWSSENRSFVRINAFREACFRPADQLSGPVVASIDPIQIDGLWTRLPECYRDVRTDRTSWWLDVCPEGASRWEESFFVTQAGTFTAPVVTVESLYAPQYGANAAHCVPLSVYYQ